MSEPLRCKTCGNGIQETAPENVRFITVRADEWETMTCTGCGQTFATRPKKQTFEYHEDDYDDEGSLEAALSKCGLTEDYDCLEAGTEHCDFWCPFSDAIRPAGQMGLRNE